MYYFLLLLLFIPNFNAQRIPVATNNSNSLRQYSHGTNIKTSTNKHSNPHEQHSNDTNVKAATTNHSNSLQQDSSDTNTKTGTTNHSNSLQLHSNDTNTKTVTTNHSNPLEQHSNGTNVKGETTNHWHSLQLHSNDTNTKTATTDHSNLLEQHSNDTNIKAATTNHWNSPQQHSNDTNTKTATTDHSNLLEQHSNDANIKAATTNHWNSAQQHSHVNNIKTSTIDGSNSLEQHSNGINIQRATTNHSNPLQHLPNNTNRKRSITDDSNSLQQRSNGTNIKTAATNNSNALQRRSNGTNIKKSTPTNTSNSLQQRSNGTNIKTATTNDSNSLEQRSNGTNIKTSTSTNDSNSFPELSNDTYITTPTTNDSLTDDQNEKRDDTLAVSTSNVDDEVDLAGVSNVHFHLTVPRYYSPYEEVPFLYFINSSTRTYTNQEQHYFSLHMGSSPYSPSYGLLLSNLSSGSYTFQIGRAYNKTWVADAVNAADNSTYNQTITVSDTYTTTSYEINVQVWSDLYGEKFYHSNNSSTDRIFLLRAHYKSIDCDIKRRIWMYLPPDYETATSKRYPVLYAHWGQLMFNYYGNSKEWGLDRLLTNAFNDNSSCDILKWGLIVVAIDALPTKLLSNIEYIVSREDDGCHSQNLIRTFSGSFKRHIHGNFRTLNQWDYTTMLGYGTAGGLVFDIMTKYYQKFGKFIILSWILDEECCESEVEINDALSNSRLFRNGNNLNKNNNNNTKKTRLYPKIFFTWTLNEEPAEITRARDTAKGLKYRGMPISNIYVDPVNTNPTSQFYGAQTIKAICWLFNNQSAESYSDIAPWWDEEQITSINKQQTKIIPPTSNL